MRSARRIGATGSLAAQPAAATRSARAEPAPLTSTRISLARAHLLAASAIHESSRAGIPASSLATTGSLRRYAPDIGDVAILATLAASHHADVLQRLAVLPMATGIADRNPSGIRLDTVRGPVSFHLTAPDHFGAALVWHTGSCRHTTQLQARAEGFGLRFEGGVLHGPGGVVPTPTEEDVYRRLDLPWIAPELREGDGEVDAAARDTLPCLVTQAQIRGDLHMHTTWSDGRDTTEGMVRAGLALGYEYIAITDHSERAPCSRKLSARDLPRQREEIASIRERFPDITVLHGVEVDIMRDGSLDFPDTLLEGFDIVLASLHDAGTQSGRELTERYLRAIDHPLVNVITHPSNRSPGLWPGYELDYPKLFDAAARSGTALEIDGAPGHLDMDGSIARLAVAAGVTVVIDSDCHRAEALGRQMRFGIGTARRGWVEPRHVLNTGDIDRVRAFVAAKRAP
jgi:DNA polymerase (family X)